MAKTLRILLVLSTALALGACSPDKPSVSIESAVTDPRVDFAREAVENALEEGTPTSPTTIRFVLTPDDPGLRPEGFSLVTTDETLEIRASDAAGLMYGGLELAEQIRLYGPDSVRAMRINPYLEMRGPKFNLPLDVRTPSYSDASDAGQRNLPHMWDLTFWQSFLDELARHRYNYVSLWSLHPFPSLVKVPGYEEIALDDVHRSTGVWKDRYNLNGIGMDAPEIIDDYEIIKRLTIDEKIAFWREVMAYGKRRNIDFHLITWNIFDYGTRGRYGITDGIDNEVTRDYFRRSVEQLFLTYPDLKGIGLTTGENMRGASPEEKEDWAYDTYARGILAAAEKMPERQFTFIHRQHQTGAREIAEKFRPIIEAPNVEFLYCFKYAKAHVYSATTQPYHEQDDYLADLGELKTLWGLRNDDTYYFRWGAPDFVREFIENLPHAAARGIYFGSDQWIWGRDFLTRDPSLADQLEIEKQWYQWLLWGRMSYDPELPTERLVALLQDRYPEADAALLYGAWQNASMVYPLVTGFHWGRLDFQWYIEAGFSHPKPAETETGFHDVNRFITLGVHPKSGNQSISDYVQTVMAEDTTDLTTPPAVAAELRRIVAESRRLLAGLLSGENPELRHVLGDITAMNHLGEYYAHKIDGATHLALLRATGDETQRERAVAALTEGLAAWKKYVAVATEQYRNPLWTNRVGTVDFAKITAWVAEDIEIARKDSGGKE